MYCNPTMNGLLATISSLTDKKKEAGREKSRIYRAKERNKELFSLADQMKSVEAAELSYQAGDMFFEEEHRQWMILQEELKKRGYSIDEVEMLRLHYKEQTAEYAQKVKLVSKELRLGESILEDLKGSESSYVFEQEEKVSKNQEIIKEKERKQPSR